jgi:hypothetical protein
VRNRSSYADAQASGFDIAIGAGPHIEAVFTISHDAGPSQTPEQLANEAVQAWERVLARLGLSR